VIIQPAYGLNEPDKALLNQYAASTGWSVQDW